MHLYALPSCNSISLLKNRNPAALPHSNTFYIYRMENQVILNLFRMHQLLRSVVHVCACYCMLLRYAQVTQSATPHLQPRHENILSTRPTPEERLFEHNCPSPQRATRRNYPQESDPILPTSPNQSASHVEAHLPSEILRYVLYCSIIFFLSIYLSIYLKIFKHLMDSHGILNSQQVAHRVGGGSAMAV